MDAEGDNYYIHQYKAGIVEEVLGEEERLVDGQRQASEIEKAFQ